MRTLSTFHRRCFAVLAAASLATIALLMSSCRSLPQEGSLERLKRDQTLELQRDCSRHPDAYGYPYTLSEYMRLPLELNVQLVDPAIYCHRKLRTRLGGAY
jgi:hypothetical protein